MKLDKWGYEVRTCSDACLSAINSYYEQVLSYGRNRSIILEAPKCDPECVLGNILAAHFLCSSDSSHATQLLDTAKSHLEQASSYEKAVFETLVYLTSPDRDDDLAVEMHSKLLQDFPRDLVSLKRAQVLCFYMGQPDPSLKLVEQVLPTNEQESYIYGMLAFPLLELGRMEDAEKAGKKGYEINKDDPWSQHAVSILFDFVNHLFTLLGYIQNLLKFLLNHDPSHGVNIIQYFLAIVKLCHVYQYECRFKEAVEFMSNCARSWGCLSSFMYTHNWWHVALCYLEGCAPIEKVQEVYDECIWKELERSDSVPAEVYLNAIGLLLRVYIRGEGEIFKGHLQDLAKCLRDQVIGASDEQLDVFTELHIILLLNTGEAVKAIQAIKKQLKKREGAPFLWRLLEKAYTALGKEEAASCGQKAGELEAAYF
ncbi:tetratricopeptide repeat protein [Striga asiatica]|uniref:Tetratricopeptide repeat protein 38 n=1 Tax=Striga asiatica TaxID=4170 RepID=A0A5A7PI27_STRAF|nr:tetratricopeptide repeat protein [Striga asiatica]